LCRVSSVSSYLTGSRRHVFETNGDVVRGDEQRRAWIGETLPHVRDRRRFIERRPGRTRFRDGQLRDESIDATRQGQADDVAAPDADIDQSVRDLVRGSVEFGVAHPSRIGDEGALEFYCNALHSGLFSHDAHRQYLAVICLDVEGCGSSAVTAPEIVAATLPFAKAARSGRRARANCTTMRTGPLLAVR
jgi:hypothetical protein